MKVALTGGTGFIGSHVLAELRQHRHDVTARVRSEAAAEAVAAGGIPDIVGRIGAHFESDPDVVGEALRELASDFDSPESHGPRRAAELDGGPASDLDAAWPTPTATWTEGVGRLPLAYREKGGPCGSPGASSPERVAVRV